MNNYLIISTFLYNFDKNIIKENINKDIKNLIENTAKELEYLHFKHSKEILKESYKSLFINNKRNIILRENIRRRNKCLYNFFKEVKSKGYNYYDFSKEIDGLLLFECKNEIKICNSKFPNVIHTNLNENILIKETKRIEHLFEFFDLLKQGWDLISGGFASVFSLVKIIWHAIKSFLKVNPSDSNSITRAVQNTIKFAKNEKQNFDSSSITKTESGIINKIISYVTNFINIKNLLKNKTFSPMSLLSFIADKLGLSSLFSEQFDPSMFKSAIGGLTDNLGSYEDLQKKELQQDMDPKEKEKYQKEWEKERIQLLGDIEIFLNKNDIINKIEIIHDIRMLLNTAGPEYQKLVTRLKEYLIKSQSPLTPENKKKIYIKAVEETKNKIVSLIKPFAQKHPYFTNFLETIVINLEKHGEKFGYKIKGPEDKMKLEIGKELLGKSLEGIRNEQDLIQKILMFFTSTSGIITAVALAVITFIYYIGKKIFNWRGKISRAPIVLQRN